MFTLIGDVVGARSLPDRGAAQRALETSLARVSRRLTPVQPLRATVADEFQGAFETLPDAVAATLLVRLPLLPEIDVRCGLGSGEVVVHDARRRPMLQDGPGWWAAREAIEVLGQRRRLSYRSWYVGSGDGPVNAYLTTRDALVGRLNDRGRRMLHYALTGRNQRQIAELEQVSKSAVSQAFARGIGAVLDAERSFADGQQG